jgi:RNA polymerase sigma-70 factor (ECF subfamily)
MEEKDEELIQRYISGTDDAFKQLIDRYTNILYNFVSRFVGTLNAADIVQEVFIKAWRNIKKFDSSRSSFKTWLFTITRNTVTDHLRKKKSIHFSDLETADEDGSFEENIVDETDLPGDLFDKVRDKENLEALLEKLPSHYRVVLSLYYQEEMTFAEIGESLGKPLNTVKSHHRRAIALLRKMVEET